MSEIHQKSKEIIADEVCYKRNYLTEVIVRVDFLNEMIDIDKVLPTKIASTISKTFPISEPKKGIVKEYQISPNGIRETLIKETQEWIFHGLNRDKKLTITPSFFFIVYNVFSSYDVLEDEFTKVISALYEFSSIIQSRRLGLRYINNVRLNEEEPLNWNRYINPKLLQTISFSNQPEYISRAFNNLEYNYGDFNLRYQFGIFNPDFPATIKQKHFVLDFDAYYDGVQEYQEIINSLRKFHGAIQTMFEMSITDEFRNKLNE